MVSRARSQPRKDSTGLPRPPGVHLGGYTCIAHVQLLMPHARATGRNSTDPILGRPARKSCDRVEGNTVGIRALQGRRLRWGCCQRVRRRPNISTFNAHRRILVGIGIISHKYRLHTVIQIGCQSRKRITHLPSPPVAGRGSDSVPCRPAGGSGSRINRYAVAGNSSGETLSRRTCGLQRVSPELKSSTKSSAGRVSGVGSYEIPRVR